MNVIKKTSIENLGYHFITGEYLPQGENEYVFRFKQNKIAASDFRSLTASEIETLVRNRNTSDNWNNILVTSAFSADLIRNCKFFGLVRIGKLEPYCLEFSDLKVPVGLYNSTIISCDIGDNVVIDNVRYLSHYIIGNEVILVNINELANSNHAKFGNGILKDGESEDVRVWIELANENGGRSVLPFSGMLAGDAYLWSKYRDDDALLQKFIAFTDNMWDKRRGYYGKIGARTVIKNCHIIKDVWIGSDAYIKGANKLKNLTIESAPHAKTQIGEGCEMVNGIMHEGCRAFYGVKAVRFVMASHSSLKYGARLINSYLGNNSTISCCEVLNSLIYPAHEQHHNNSFLTAATIMGQSNMAAGATIGSNHNSRSADGEIAAGRGFWPGLCVSLKHNSKFACYTILAKGDYPAELNITIPFSLVSNDVKNDRLTIMPAFWFMYNMYALARNSWKYVDRDKRSEKIQLLEYDYLAPDSMQEVMDAIALIERCVGAAYLLPQGKHTEKSEKELQKLGKKLLMQSPEIVDTLMVTVPNTENSKRPVVLLKVVESYRIFKQVVVLYAGNLVFEALKQFEGKRAGDFIKQIPTSTKRVMWDNIGGQLIPSSDISLLRKLIKDDKIKSWSAVHDWYVAQGNLYTNKKWEHAMACYFESTGMKPASMTTEWLQVFLQEVVAIKATLTQAIHKSREKDYTNAFRQMMYANVAEMEAVVGKLADNNFIKQQQQQLKQVQKQWKQLQQKFGWTVE
ncbi:MAG: DUF4954 family protein [Chitinophagaceae bacterium]